MMNILKQDGFVQDIIGSPFPKDRFKVEAQISWWWMKYHEYGLK